jgi:uncharacterized protein YkwD
MKKSYLVLIAISILVLCASLLTMLSIRYNPLTFKIFNSEGNLESDRTYFLKSKYEGEWVDLAQLDLMNGNYLVFLGGYKYEITNQQFIKVDNFKGLIKINEKNELIIGEHRLKFETTSLLLLDTNSNSLWMMEGIGSLNGSDFTSGNKIVLSDSLVQQRFDRNEILESFREFLKIGEKTNLLPNQLKDFDPPTLVVNDYPTETNKNLVSITIECNNCTVLFVGEENLSENILDGLAGLERELSLEIGENSFLVYALDEYGNRVEENIIINRLDMCDGNIQCGECGNPACPTPTSKPNKPVQTPILTIPKVTSKPTPTTVPISTPVATSTPSPVPAGSCASGAFNNSFLTLINNYRQSQGLNTLTIEANLTKAAYNHSFWMANGGNFSHTGENGSTPWDRCRTAGTSCDAENLAYGTSDASRVFDMWKNSPGHNANMLGTHSVLGICVVNGYSTLVLR